MKTLIHFLILTASLVSLPAFAGGLIRGDFGYVSESDKSGTSDSSTSKQNIEFAGGFAWPSGLAVFGMYQMGTDTTTSGGTTTTNHRTSYGPGIGYYSRAPMGFYIAGTYFISSKLQTPSTTYSGKGYQVDLGIRAAFGNIAALAGLAYDAFEYNKTDAGAVTPPWKVTSIGPRIGVQFEF